MSRAIRIEKTAGPVWLPRRPARKSRYTKVQGDSELKIEQRSILGRLGWQQVTQTFMVVQNAR